MGMKSWVMHYGLELKGKKEDWNKHVTALKDIEELWGEGKKLFYISDSGDVRANLNDRKIISYWYPETIEMLKKMNEHLIGFISLYSDPDEPLALIKFTDQGVKVKQGFIQWEESDSDI